MKTYKILILPKAEKQLAQLPRKEADKIAQKINALATIPTPQGSKKLVGYDGLYRVRQGDYRIIYEIKDHQLIITVIKIGHRKDVYE